MRAYLAFLRISDLIFLLNIGVLVLCATTDSRHAYRIFFSASLLSSAFKIAKSVNATRTVIAAVKSEKSFFRSMSKAELNAVKESGKLRGGRTGETFFTDSRFRTSVKAQKRLALPQEPEVQVEFRIKNTPKLERNGTRVQPAYNQRGGGKEFMTFDPVEVEVINVQPY